MRDGNGPVPDWIGSVEPPTPPRKRSRYPVAKPYAPPPEVGAPAPRAVKPPPAPPVYRPPMHPAPAWLGVVWKGIAVVSVGLLCMGFGWFLFRGPGARALSPAPTTPQVAVNTSPPKPTLPQETKPTATVKETRAESVPVLPPPPSRPEPRPEPIPPVPPKPIPSAVTFDEHILPIFEAKCTLCHGALKKSAKLDVRTIAALKKGGSGGPSLLPGMPEQSLLWDEVVKDRMPPNGKNLLTVAEKKTLREWIASGAK